MTGAPFYFIYGEPPRPIDPHFVHVERVSDRSELHDGKVEAHRHDHMHQISFWEGQGGRYLLDDRWIVLPRRALTIVPAGVTHGFVIEGATDARVLSISRQFGDDYLSGTAQRLAEVISRPALIPVNEDAAARLGNIFAAIEEEYRFPAWGQGDAISAYVCLMLVLAGRLDQLGDRDNRPRRGNDLATRFLIALDEHIRDGWKVADYVRALGTTPYLLNRAAQARLGCRPSAAIRDHMIMEAKRLLLYTALDIGEVAFTLGIDDPAHFGRSFRKVTGHSPGDWRRLKLDREREGLAGS
ncbi:MAG TPA: AraC family transcriptional regulator [Sphingomonas sp.]|nr:AraC family transcriptional regulator [Sphingomonas sp.]